MKTIIKNNIKFIIVVLVCVFSSILVTYATGSYLFNSSDVKYDNTESGLDSTNVSDAIDELFFHATDYNEINSRFTNGVLNVSNGGTGASTAANARTNLGLGNAATQTVANNLTTTASGYVLDARQGKVLNDKITALFISENKSVTLDSNGYGVIGTKTGYTPIFAYNTGDGGGAIVYYAGSNYSLWAHLLRSCTANFRIIWAKI